MLKGDAKLSGRITRQWEEIGFQGADPATDFRGAGVLGLDQLAQLCSRKESLSMFRESEYTKDESGKVKEGWYFFCVTGLNITAKLITSLTKGLFDSTVLSLMEQERGGWTLAEALDHWYYMIWLAFHAKWVGEKKEMMAFN